MCALLLFCAFIGVLIKSRGKFDSFAVMGLISVLLVPSIGLGISLISTPIYTYRYIIPMFDVLWLSFSILFSKIENKKVILSIIAIILICGVVGTFGFINHQQTDHQETLEKYEGYQNSIINSNDITVLDDFVPFVELKSFYLSNCTFYKISDNLIKVASG